MDFYASTSDKRLDASFAKHGRQLASSAPWTEALKGAELQ